MATTVHEQIEKRIVEALAEFGADRDALTPEATLEDLDVDSLDLFELSQILNQEFGLEVNPEDFEGIETLGDAQRILLSYVK
jgi:acyl carrier protein